MIIQEKLLAAGYKKSVSSHYKTFKSTDTLYQKCIRDELGKRYYINAWYYSYADYPQIPETESVEFEVQFKKKGSDDAIMDVTLFTKDIKEAETYFAFMWKQLDLGYYEWEDE
jgi:hypothetical protein